VFGVSPIFKAPRTGGGSPVGAWGWRQPKRTLGPAVAGRSRTRTGAAGARSKGDRGGPDHSWPFSGLWRF